MYDIHCHLIPGIDDGPDSIDEALALARQSVADGITHAVVTPHIHHGRWDNTRLQIYARMKSFKAALHTHAIPLNIAAAAEVRIGPELAIMYERDELPFLGEWQGKKVLLLEMPHSQIIPGTDKLITWLLDHDIVPLIPHPERNKDVIKDINKLEPLIEAGCLFQVTAGALWGQFGSRAKQRARTLLERGLVTVIASDAHHTNRRPVNLHSGKVAAAALVGAEIAEDLVFYNPRLITQSLFEESSEQDDQLEIPILR